LILTAVKVSLAEVWNGYERVNGSTFPLMSLCPDFRTMETLMPQLFRACAVTITLFSSAGFAVAQNAPSRAPGTVHPELTSSQEQAVKDGLSTYPSQHPSSGAQPKVGDKIPSSMTADKLPDNISNQVPQAKNLLFVKLPDRVMLIDPDTQTVTEVLMEASTTGSTPQGSDRPSR
jgi:hypothetical protein